MSTGWYAHLNCTLNSSSMSSSSQLSSHSLSPSDFAAPGATPPRCARSVWESSQSKLVRMAQQTSTRERTRAALTLDGKLLKLIVLLEHTEMRECLIPLFWRLCCFGYVFCLGCCGRGGHCRANRQVFGWNDARGWPRQSPLARDSLLRSYQCSISPTSVLCIHFICQHMVRDHKRVYPRPDLVTPNLNVPLVYPGLGRTISRYLRHQFLNGHGRF